MRFASPIRLITIGMALFAAQFAWVIYNTYVPLFLQTGSAAFDALRPGAGSWLAHGFGLSAAQTGLIMSLDNMAAFLLLPLTGLLSDHTRSRLGRRLPFLLAGMPAAALGVALIPLMLPASEGAQASHFIAFMACVLLFVAAMALWRAPLFALMADLTPSPQRPQANGMLNLMAGLGGVLAFTAGSLFYGLFRPLPFWVAALLLVAACALILARVREPSLSSLSQEGSPLGRWLSLRQGLAQWNQSLPPARRKSLILLAVAVFCYMMGFHPIEAFFSSYGVSVLKLSEANSGLVLSAAYITFILAAVPAGMLAAKIGRKRTVLIGLVLFAAALLIAFFTPVVSVMVALMALGGIGWAFIDINGFIMVLDTAPGQQGTDLGTASGIYFIATTLAATLGPVLNGWLIDASGRNYSTIFLIGPAFFGLAFAAMSLVQHGEAAQAHTPPRKS